MRVWIITVGEPLPIDAGQERLLRSGILSTMLAERGHEVIWWTSTFDHIRKRHRFSQDTMRTSSNGIDLRLLHGFGYQENISLRRIADHMQVARHFAQFAPSAPQPDLILCSLPTLELAVAATRYGNRSGVPVVIDVRDLWPDIVLELAPAWARPMWNGLLLPVWRQARVACRTATAICASSPRFVDWGLRHANRARTVLDRDFPFGYATFAPEADKLTAANDFWRSQGVAPDGNGFIACFFGTMGDQFDLETVIEASRLLENRGIPIQVVLCGAGPRLELLKQQARGLASVRFPGWVGAAEIWVLMRRASVGLAPYLDNAGFADNYPNKTIEYLSAGLPVVSSLRGYFRELLDQYGFGVSYTSGSPQELADALAAIFSNPVLRAGMSRRAHAVFQEHFEAGKVYGAMIDYLIEVTKHYSAALPS